MPPKTDLSAFKKPSLKSVLSGTPKPVSPPDKLLETKPRSKPKVAKKRVGRKPKPAAEKESEMIGLMLTPLEKARLAKKAGLAPLGTFIKHHLRTETDLLE